MPKDSMNLSPSSKFLFITMMQAALKCREMKMVEKDFLEFAKISWETMLLNDEKELKEILKQAMLNDLPTDMKKPFL